MYKIRRNGETNERKIKSAIKIGIQSLQLTISHSKKTKENHALGAAFSIPLIILGKIEFLANL